MACNAAASQTRQRVMVTVRPGRNAMSSCDFASPRPPIQPPRRSVHNTTDFFHKTHTRGTPSAACPPRTARPCNPARARGGSARFNGR